MQPRASCFYLRLKGNANSRLKELVRAGRILTTIFKEKLAPPSDCIGEAPARYFATLKNRSAFIVFREEALPEIAQVGNFGCLPEGIRSWNPASIHGRE